MKRLELIEVRRIMRAGNVVEDLFSTVYCTESDERTEAFYIEQFGTGAC